MLNSKNSCVDSYINVVIGHGKIRIFQSGSFVRDVQPFLGVQFNNKKTAGRVVFIFDLIKIIKS